MFIFTRPFRTLAKRIAYAAVLLLVVQLWSPAALTALAENTVDAQIQNAYQNEVSTVFSIFELKESIRQQAEAMRQQADAIEQQYQNDQPAPAPAPEPTPAPTPAPDASTGGSTSDGSASDSSNQSAGSATDTGSSTPQTTPTTTSSGGATVNGTETGTQRDTLPGYFDADGHWVGDVPDGPTTEVHYDSGSATSGGGNGINISNQADDAVNIGERDETATSTIETTNQADIDRTHSAVTDTGHNYLECQGKCEGSLTAGAATTDVATNNNVNTSDVSSGGGATWPGMRYGWGPNSTIENGGDGAVNIGDTTILKELAVIQENDAFVNNNFEVIANSGANDALTNYKFKDFTFETKEALSSLALLNKVNTNLFNSEWWNLYIGVTGDSNNDINLLDSMIERFGSSSKFNLFNPEAAASILNTQEGEDAFNQALIDLREELRLSSTQSGIIKNNLKVIANTGGNNAISAYKIKDFELKTGPSVATLTLLNYLNTQLAFSHWATGVINIFSDSYSGNLILPSMTELLWGNDGISGSQARRSDQVQINSNGEDSFSKATVIQTTDQKNQVVNNANVESRVTTSASTGDDIWAFYDDLEDSSEHTGVADILTSQFTMGNTVKVGGGTFQLIFNNLGNWNGRFEGLPENATVEQKGRQTIVTFESESGGNLAGLAGGTPSLAARIDNRADDAVNVAEVVHQRSIDITTNNNGKIVNQIDIVSNTGQNTIGGLDGRRITAETGNAKAVTTIGNVFNTTLIGAKAFQVVVNVMGGDWNGNIQFKKSLDLATSLWDSSDGTPEPGEVVNYTVEYSNLHNQEKAENAVLTAYYDAQKTTLTNAGGATQPTPGTLQWNIGTIEPGTTGTKTFTVRVKKPLPDGTHILVAGSEITSPKPEAIMSNNAKSRTVTVIVGGGTGSSASSGGSNTGSGSTSQGGDSQSNGNTDTSNNSNSQGQDNQQGSSNSNTGTSSGSGAGSGGGSGNTSSGGGGGSTSSNGAASLRVTKTAQTNGSNVVQGTTVPYTIVVVNNGETSAMGVTVHDTLMVNGKADATPFSWDLGEVFPHEEVRIEYEVDILPDAGLGNYINTAYAEGKDVYNNSIRSNDAQATVVVVKGNGTAAVKADSGANGNATQVLAQHAASDIQTQPTPDDTSQEKSEWTVVDGQENASGVVLGTNDARDGSSSASDTDLPDGSADSRTQSTHLRDTNVRVTRGIPIIGTLSSFKAQPAYASSYVAVAENTNADAVVLALGDLDANIDDHMGTSAGFGAIKWLWGILLLMVVTFGVLALIEYRKEKVKKAQLAQVIQ